VTTAPAVEPPPLEVDALGGLELVDFHVSPEDAIAGAAVREVGLPRDALIAVVSRADETIPPRGSTVIEPGDRLYVLLPRGRRPDLEDVFSRWRRRV
jgi:cell volume regulation protein A